LSSYLLVAIAAASWGTWPIWLRGTALPPLAQATLVLATVGLGGLPFALAATRARRAEERGLEPGFDRGRGPVGRMLLLSGLDAANHFLYFAALAAGPVAPASLSHYLAPVLVALGAPALLGERRSRRTLPAALIALVGLVLLLLPDTDALAGKGVLAATLLGGGSAAFYAGGVLLARRMNAGLPGARPDWRPIEVVSYHCLGSSLLLLTLSAGSFGGVHPRMILGLVVPALVLGLAGGTAFYVGLARVPAAHAGVLTYLEPLVAVIGSLILLGEGLSLGGAIGGALILAAGLAVVTEPRG
jgi:drug/metabolite transporter (DMT)-like permease